MIPSYGSVVISVSAIVLVANVLGKCQAELLDPLGEVLIDKVIATLNGVVPNFQLGERFEYKELALNDHANDDLFDATTQEILEAAGFKSATHMVTTSDGYITELINIINPLADRRLLKGPPVVMFHGGLIDSSAFVWSGCRQHHPERYPRTYREDGPISSSNRSVAMMLANNGYDVWLVGSRGSNRNNLGHTHYKTKLLEDLLPELWDKPSEYHARRIIDTLKYFEYSQDQLVEIEYPAQIDEILRLTGSKQVSVLTYSKSSLIVMKMLASGSSHAKKIYSHVTMGPILNLVGSSNLWKTLSSLALLLPNPVGNLLFTQVFESSLVRNISRKLPRYTIGWYLTTLLGGPSPRYLSRLEDSVDGHILMPFSYTEVKHYCQQVLAGKLQKFDHGPIKNKLIYNGSITPPEYDISNIDLKRWMMVSAEYDVLGTQNSAQTYYNLHQHKPDPWIEVKQANHVDLSASFEHDVKVNLPILEFMERHKKGPAKKTYLAGDKRASREMTAEE